MLAGLLPEPRMLKHVVVRSRFLLGQSWLDACGRVGLAPYLGKENHLAEARLKSTASVFFLSSHTL